MDMVELLRRDWLELEKVISLREAAELAGVSEDTLKRHHRNKIRQMSPHRLGMRVKDALSIATPIEK